jgi:hypothetical protein
MVRGPRIDQEDFAIAVVADDETADAEEHDVLVASVLEASHHAVGLGSFARVEDAWRPRAGPLKGIALVVLRARAGRPEGSSPLSG